MVIVRDARGNPMPNVAVTWTVSTSGNDTGQVGSATTTTGSDGTSSNTFILSAPLLLLVNYVQATVKATALGSSVTFTETNGAVANDGTGIAKIEAGLLSPPSGTVLTGPAGSTFSTPVHVNVGVLTGGGVPGVEVRIVSDPTLPATAVCAAGAANSLNSVLTDANGNAICNLQFGSVAGQGKIKVYAGGNYSVWGPFVITVTPGSGTPPPSPGALTANPSSLTFQSPGPLTQTVSVTSSSGTVNYTAAVQVTLAQVSWLTVGAPTGPASSSGASTFQVTINPQSLQAGTYRATIAVHPANGSADVVIPVQLTVGSPGPTGPPAGTGSLSLSPSSLTFQYPGPLTQTVTVSTSGGPVTYTAAVQITLAQVTWLTVGAPTGPASSNSPSTFQVSIVPSQLTAGTYHAAIGIHPNNGTPDLAIPVQVTVGSTAAPAQLTASPSSLTFQSSGAMTQTVTVSSSSGSVAYTVAVPPNISWLTAGSPSGPASSTAASTFAVNIAAQSLQAGTYQSTITIHANNGSPDVTIPVQLTVQAPAVPSSLNVSPAALNLTQTAGTTTPPSGAINVTTSTGSAVPFITSTSGVNWLSITPGTGTTPGQVMVSANSTGLQPGSYTATVTITAPGASNSPVSIPVSFTIQAAQSLRLSTNTLTFNSQLGSPAPAGQSIAAMASDGSLPFNATATVTSPPGGNWLSVTPSSGTASGTPSGLTVSVNPNALAPGSYSGTVTFTSPSAVNSPQIINVVYTIGLPTPSPTLIVNGASGMAGPVAPGEIISIFGHDLGPPTGVPELVNNGFVQTLIGETQVSFDGIAAPVLYVSATQINTIVPYEIAARDSTKLVITYKNTPSPAITLNVADSAPGIFVINSAGQGAIQNADGTGNDPTRPAAKGTPIVIYATGEGATTPAGADGEIIPVDVTQLKTPVLPVTVTIGGSPAQVLYAGSAPSLVSGMLQVNAVVPDDAASGSAVPVVITVGTASSQPATMAIQ